jgi:hypothetical protein
MSLLPPNQATASKAEGIAAMPFAKIYPSCIQSFEFLKKHQKGPAGSPPGAGYKVRAGRFVGEGVPERGKFAGKVASDFTSARGATSNPVHRTPDGSDVLQPSLTSIVIWGTIYEVEVRAFTSRARTLLLPRIGVHDPTTWLRFEARPQQNTAK